jgi:hypothetical protein
MNKEPDVNLRSVATAPLFRSVDKRRHLTVNPMTRTDVLRMIRRRALAAGLWDAENEAQAREWGGDSVRAVGGPHRRWSEGFRPGCHTCWLCLLSRRLGNLGCARLGNGV